MGSEHSRKWISLRRFVAEYQPRLVGKYARLGWAIFLGWLVAGTCDLFGFPWAGFLVAALASVTGLYFLFLFVWHRGVAFLVSILSAGALYSYLTHRTASPSEYSALVGISLGLLPFGFAAVTASLGDSQEDLLFGQVAEAVSDFAFCRDGGSRVGRYAGRILRYVRVRGVRRLLLMGIQYDAARRRRGRTPAQLAASRAADYLGPARSCGLPEPERSLLEFLLEGARALGSLTDGQEEYLRALGRAFGMDEALVEARICSARRLLEPMDRSQAARLLGLAPQARPEEVERAYRRAIEGLQDGRLSGETSPDELARARSILIRRSLFGRVLFWRSR